MRSSLIQTISAIQVVIIGINKFGMVRIFIPVSVGLEGVATILTSLPVNPTIALSTAKFITALPWSSQASKSSELSGSILSESVIILDWFVRISNM